MRGRNKFFIRVDINPIAGSTKYYNFEPDYKRTRKFNKLKK